MSAFVPTDAPEADRASVQTVDICRSKLYPVVARPGFAWQWEYGFRTDGSDWLDWGTSLREVRDVIKRRYPNAIVRQTWPQHVRANA